MISFRHRIFTLLLAVGAAGLLAACSAINEPERPCPEPERGNDPVTLSFRLTTATNIISSRADSQPGHTEEDDETDQERTISLDDYAFYIFWGSGADATLLYKMENLADTGDGDVTMAGATGNYTVSLVLPHSLVEEGLGHELTPDGASTVDLRIAVLANTNASRTGRYEALSAITAEAGSTYGQFIEEAAKKEYRVNYGTNFFTEGLIPMFGTCAFTVTEAEMYHSRPDQRIELGEIWLLRAMNKIRFVDNIEGKSADGYPRVVGATTVYKSKGGRVLPADAVSYINGEQVHTPNAAISTTVNNITRTMLASASTGLPSWICYSPEQPVDIATPVTIVRVARSAAEEATPAEFEVDLTQFADAWAPAMLRNHIYTVEVSGVNFGAALQLKVTVADWDSEELTVDYSDQVGVGMPISWIESTFNPGDNNRIIMLPWSGGKPQPAECNFRLDTPRGATWTASLITTEGTTGAFAFQLPDGSTAPTMSGVIDGNLSTLRVVTAAPVAAQRNAARLQVIVTLADGTFMPSKLTDYTIVQNPQ